MRTKRLGTPVIAAVLLILFGCRNEGSDERLIDLAVKVNKQEDKLDQMARRIEGIERRLDEILAATGKGSVVSDQSRALRTGQQQAVDFRKTPEYEQILAALAAVQQQLSTTQNKLAEAKEGFQQDGRPNPVPLVDISFAATRDPQEFAKRLDSLVENFAHRIDDPTRRQEFVSAVEYLKHINADGLSTQELYERLVASLRERLSTQEDEGTRSWIGQQLKQVESASAEELQGVLERVRGSENLAMLGEIRKEYDIPSEAMQQAGLPPANSVFRVLQSGDGGIANIAIISSSETTSPGDKAAPSRAIRLEWAGPQPETQRTSD
jgi:uncharacterized phage infection (PIP) family protein YhgE